MTKALALDSRRVMLVCLYTFVGILASLIVVAETAYLQAMQTLDILDVEVEITCHIRGEVVFRHLEEQLVLVYGIRNIGQEEHELVVAFVAKALCWVESLLLITSLLIDHTLLRSNLPP